MEKRENKEVQPSTRRRLQGIVVSNKMQKTIVVETENYRKHPVYKKRVSIRKKYKVNDKKEIAQVGDVVIIEECRIKDLDLFKLLRKEKVNDWNIKI